MYKYHCSADRCSWPEVREEDKAEQGTERPQKNTAEEETLKEKRKYFSLRVHLKVLISLLIPGP